MIVVIQGAARFCAMERHIHALRIREVDVRPAVAGHSRSAPRLRSSTPQCISVPDLKDVRIDPGRSSNIDQLRIGRAGVARVLASRSAGGTVRSVRRLCKGERGERSPGKDEAENGGHDPGANSSGSRVPLWHFSDGVSLPAVHLHIVSDMLASYCGRFWAGYRLRQTECADDFALTGCHRLPSPSLGKLGAKSSQGAHGFAPHRFVSECHRLG